MLPSSNHCDYNGCESEEAHNDIQNFPDSEPEYLISCMDRQIDRQTDRQTDGLWAGGVSIGQWSGHQQRRGRVDGMDRVSAQELP